MVEPLLIEYGIRRKSCVGKVDVDANQEFAAKYGKKYSKLIFHNGEVVGKQVGVAPKQTDSLDALL
jgi:thioredoxin 1